MAAVTIWGIGCGVLMVDLFFRAFEATHPGATPFHKWSFYAVMVLGILYSVVGRVSLIALLRALGEEEKKSEEIPLANS